jgi:predicted transglutaminase-like cysteine proteinase
VSAGVRWHCLVALIALAPGVAMPVQAVTERGLLRYDFDAHLPLAPAERLPSWADALRRAGAEQSVFDACEQAPYACPRHLRAWRHIVQSARTLEPARRIELAHRFVNRRAWEMESYRADDWKTLSEFLRRGGDCEDFAFAKYLLLRHLGFAARDLRVVIAFDRQTREHHAVLAVRDGDRVRLLDVVDRSYGARAAPTYRFLYAMNETAVWDHTRSRGQAAEREWASRPEPASTAREEEMP